MLSNRAHEEKSHRLIQVGEQIAERLSRVEADEVHRFARLYYERVAPRDVTEESVENLYGAALAVWKFAAQRTPGRPKLRIYNPRVEEHGWKSPHTIVEIVNDDMPFLVDSVTGALTRAGQQVLLVIHPIVHVHRDEAGRRTALLDGPSANGHESLAESVMHIEISEHSDPAGMEALQATLERTLADVRAAVEDWRPMLARLDECIEELGRNNAPFAAEEVEETRAFLEWMRDNHFTFVGCREFAYSHRGGRQELAIVEDSGLGILREPARHVLARGTGSADMAPIVQEFLNRPELMLITKTSVRGTVHRPVHMDYIGVKRFDAKGKLVGERRFVGLFTSSAYSRTPRAIPLLRRKVSRMLDRAGLNPNSHDGKALVHILETYPRDELFQIDDDTLYRISTGILLLQERPQIRLFARRDTFRRYYSCIVFLPRERLTTELRQRFSEILVQAFDGRVSNYYTQVGESPLARLHFIIGTDADGAGPEQADYDQIEARLVTAARSWQDDLCDALVERWGEAGGNRLAGLYAHAFPTAYEETFSAALAVGDVEKMESLKSDDDLALNFYRSLEDPEYIVRLKLYQPGEAVALSDCLPMLENMGLKVLGETPFRLEVGGRPLWIQDMHLEVPQRRPVDLARYKQAFETAFDRVWRGAVEDDGFNRLVLHAGLGWRDIVVLRAYCKYLRQAGIPFSQAYMEDTLAGNAGIARLLVELFHLRFDVAFEGDRASAVAAKAAEIEAALEEVASLDEDRILRRYLNVVQSTLRTNDCQAAADGGQKDYLSFKLDSGAVIELPLPRPFREIFVYSSRFEAVHLRGGRVARGGLRWSDRREDFRTEVLGLMKAQMVKNAVIVPVGSKGGFVTKRLPAGGDREAVQAEVVECYKTFIRGMLDITDNLAGGGVVPPDQVVRYDDDDPYLVVAADKGTATFSDIANGVSLEYGYWLGDAFASGGAVGYDHKGMGITARGGWESVKRHFRELGRDIQNEDFDVVGVGDMSGDVFGNGMLLSRHIRLRAAFDHRHVFVDPDPDPATSWAERERLFRLPRSSWDDYDKSLISAGGGVFARNLKSIALTPQMKALSGLEADKVTPNELIRALLTADVDLLWFGGIGTYVKASGESNDAVGDRGNDPLRVDARQLRAKVLGEGANLAVTQRGRIEFAMKGGRLNTDAVDNSAGVDCSDHEVNIKILLDAIVDDGEMTTKQRNKLLAEMTEEVGELVLRNNYVQTLALSMLQVQAPDLLESHARFMRALEREGRLDRTVEFLPDEEALADRNAAGLGLTRPELAVLLAYAKMKLYEQLVDSDLVESEHLTIDLVKYFPRPLRKGYQTEILNHRLRKEIIATVTANSIVNRVGITFVHDLMADTECSAGAVARAYAATRDAFWLRQLWTAIGNLDNRMPADLQNDMHIASAELVRRGTTWFLRNIRQPLRITAMLDTYAPGIKTLMDNLDDILGELELRRFQAKTARYVERGAPEHLARRVAALEPLAAALDIVNVANAVGRPVEEVGRIYFALGGRLGLDWLREAAGSMGADSHWERTASSVIVEDLFTQQRALTRCVFGDADGSDGAQAMEAWCGEHKRGIDRCRDLIVDIRNSGGLDLAKLALANRCIGRLIVS